jgi:hypothetical protein
MDTMGDEVPEVVRAIGISEVSYYRWRKEYGGHNVSQAKRLKDLARRPPPTGTHTRGGSPTIQKCI